MAVAPHRMAMVMCETLGGVTAPALVDGVVRTAVTNVQGKYMLRLPAGTYDNGFSLPGTEPFTISARPVRPGVMGRVNVVLQPALPDSPTMQPIVEQPATGDLLRRALEEMATNGEVAASEG